MGTITKAQDPALPRIGIALLLLVCATGSLAFAHGELDEQIANVTKQIASDPTNAKLHWKRGELRRLHQDWDTALADFERAATLDPNFDAIHVARARLFLDVGWNAAARTTLDRYLADHTDDAAALLLRSRALIELKQHKAAANDLTRAIKLSSDVRPEMYIDLSRAHLALGDRDAALQSLDQGTARLGPIVSLELEALDIEIKANRIDAALQRVDRIAASSPRKERWLFRRGEILTQAGRGSEARRTYQQALDLIAALPARHREKQSILSLRKQIDASIQRLEEKP